MFVYTVNPGDSIFTISQKYDISVDIIRGVNGLVNPNIVPGQALLINTKIYTVQPGDSLYTISQKAYVSSDMLIAANPKINPSTIQPGMKIILPELPNYIATTLGYFYVTGTQSDQLVIRDFAPYTTYYSFFEYHFNLDGSLSSLNDLQAIESAWNSHTAPLATITNLTAAGFSAELTSQTLNNPASRQNFINNIFTLLSQKGYAGVNIDFEGTLAKDRDIFSTFLNELGSRLHIAGLLVTIAVPAKTSADIPWYAGYDYGAIGSVVDFMFIMAYDWHHMASEPGAVAPLNEVRKTIEFAVQKMDRSKIVLGIPLYGYNWALPYNSEVLATAISNQDAIDLAMSKSVPINYSVVDEAPNFYYVDENGQRHVVWFEDTRSIAAKMKLVREYRLHGIGAWQVGLGFPQGPWLLTKFFRVRKVT
ncbi:sporulation protein [Oceanobacillus arenosus]|uniref:Sporulation protein n=1 Tax=Oceanobacillus arenosus TaxID=1229153 RepID=A0A3D8PW90_9BACI|nr:glycosyl hydrolase family 18 protein [Oceanobacillus arenosus]RDW20363.1 sporulation protein [Oceanobacillus arenosus]